MDRVLAELSGMAAL